MSAHVAPYVAVEEAGERRRSDRRARDGAQPQRRLDTMFAATLVNHLTPPETVYGGGYPKHHVRAGIAFDVRA